MSTAQLKDCTMLTNQETRRSISYWYEGKRGREVIFSQYKTEAFSTFSLLGGAQPTENYRALKTLVPLLTYISALIYCALRRCQSGLLCTSSSSTETFARHRMDLNTSISTKVGLSKEKNEVDIDAIMEKVLIFLYSLTVILGICGNTMVIWVTGFRMRRAVTNVWLCNLAVADLIFCFTRTTSLIKNLFFSYWPFGSFLCKFNGFFKYANMFCSVFLLAVISLDRCISVLKPVRTRQHRTLPMATLTSVAVWALAVGFSLPYFIFRQTSPDPENGNLTKCSFDVPGSSGSETKLALYIVRFLCGFLLPFLVISISYTLAGCKLWQTRLSRKGKSLKLIMALVCAFFLCWAPYHFFLLAKMVNKKSMAVKIGLPLFKGLAYLNSCINPILYFCMGLDRNKRFNQSLSAVYRRALAEDSESSTMGRSIKRERDSIDNSLDVAEL
ncbi:fMet-Leu-Phe receptor isoform X1 [Lepisosteus oculatus]|uniref:fMet-Leu-Phe receptor isoform X1 n=2 Tax=Lepisosteus oculatus TaxID=7918 RepID=UPI003713F146